jgi:hypothetical protein
MSENREHHHHVSTLAVASIRNNYTSRHAVVLSACGCPAGIDTDTSTACTNVDHRSSRQTSCHPVLRRNCHTVLLAALDLH